jgi:transposase InsO family protein
MVEMERLRRRWRWTGAQIAESVGVSRATAARTLRQLGLNRLDALEPVTAGRRYEWARAGQLLHLDIKKLGRIGQVGHRITGDRRDRTRGIGWEFVHVCIDDCSRVAYVEVLPDERSVTVVGFLRRALTWFAHRGVVGERILTDNGSAYRSRLLAAVCRARDLTQRSRAPALHAPTARPSALSKPCCGSAAYRFAYPSSAQRTRVLQRWLHYYNWHRRHSALNGQPPISRVLSQDNLLRLHS